MCIKETFTFSQSFGLTPVSSEVQRIVTVVMTDDFDFFLSISGVVSNVILMC